MRDDFPITIRDLVSVGLISDVKDGVKLLAKVRLIYTHINTYVIILIQHHILIFKYLTVCI